MAFKPADNNTAANSGIPANKKATAYLNFYLPNKDGTRRKINTGLVLREANGPESTLAAWLLDDADGNKMEQFKAALIIECNSAEIAESAGFDLPGM